MKFLIDMNLSPRWVDAPDTTIMAFAHDHAYAVLTHDLDFSAILAATHSEKPSVVQIRATPHPSPGRSGGGAN